MNFTVITHFKHDNPVFESIVYGVDKETYSTEEELLQDVLKCLENDNVAYVHYKNDAFDNYNQKLYTKDERHLRTGTHITSHLV